MTRFEMVVALDLTEYAEVVLEHALDQAVRHDAPDLHILAVVERGGDAELEVAKEKLLAMVTPALESFGHPRGHLHGWRVRLHVRKGEPADEICALAGEVEADLIVVGRFGVHARARKLYLGSVADRVLRGAGCPTLVVQLTDHQPSELPAQCPHCVEARRRSDGEQWFCAAHSGGSLGTSSLLLPHAEPTLRGGLMW
jgi:nucleotide-binding universal stress UspA family protein